MKLGKWIGAGLGWVYGGVLGAILGLALGAIFDELLSYKLPQQVTTKGDFILSMLVLVAAVMKADNRVVKSELEYVKRYLIQNFGLDMAKDATIMLRDLLRQNIPITEVTDQVKFHLDYASRLQLIHFLYGISQSDGHVHPRELEMIDLISNELGVSMSDRISIKSMFIDNLDNAYKILEIEKEASNDEVKKAYRSMALKYHPDKVNHLGEEIKRAAEEKFRKVKDAYDRIKKERGIK